MRSLTTWLMIICLLLLTGCGPKKPTAGGQYHIDQDGYGFGPGADKIILSLHGGGQFDVKAGPVLMLDGTWEIKDNLVVFSKGQGAIAVSYRIEDKKLIPLKDGQEVKGWRWKQ